MSEDDLQWTRLAVLETGLVGGLVVDYATTARAGEHASGSARAAAVVSSVHKALIAATQGERPRQSSRTLPDWLVEAVAWRLQDPLNISPVDAIAVRALERLDLHHPRHNSDYVLAMLGLPAGWSDRPDERIRLTSVQAGQLVERFSELEAGSGPPSEVTYSTRVQHRLVSAVGSQAKSRQAVIGAAIAGWDDAYTKQKATWLVSLLNDLAPTPDEWEPHAGALLAAAANGRFGRIRTAANDALRLIGIDRPKRHRFLRHEIVDRLRKPLSVNAFASAQLDPAVLGGLLTEHGQGIDQNGTMDPAARLGAKRRAIWEAVEDALRGRTPKQPAPTPPSWVPALLKDLFRDRDLRIDGHEFACVRVIERSGLFTLQADELYISAMITGLGGFWTWESNKNVAIADWFAADSALIERGLWKIFDVPGYGTTSLTSIDGYNGGAWRKAILVMSEQGALDRNRLLDACLTTLASDWPPFRLRWFLELLADLAPTPSEIDARQSAYRRLLGSAATPVITLGLDSLIAIEHRGKLDDDATLGALGSVMASAPKAQTMRALRLLSTIQDRWVGDEPLHLLTDALSHPNSDVQRAVSRRLLATVERSVLAALVEERSVDPAVRRTLGLAQPTPQAALVLPASIDQVALHPVNDTDLVDRLAALLERPDDPMEIELVLDRLARTPDGSRLAPLTARAKAIVKRGPGDWDGPDWLAGQLAGLVLAASGGVASIARPTGAIERFLSLRLHEVEQVLVGAAPPRPLAATPDDPAGWITADALVSRLSGDVPNRPADVVAALLRLHPHGRQAALSMVRGQRELDSIVRHALGANPDQAVSISTPDWWVAASRARDPLADDQHLLSAGLNRTGQGRALRPRISVSKDREAFWTASVGIDFPRRDSPELQPTVPGTVDRWNAGSNLWIPWSATVWPHDAEHVLLGQIDGMLSSVVYSGATASGPLFRSLRRHPGRLGLLTATAIGLGLSSSNPEDRILAADLLIDVTTHGRMSPAAIADAMAVVVEPCVATRWAASLRVASDGGAGTAVIALLTALLPQLPTGKSGIHALLELLAAEQLRNGASTTDPNLRVYLSQFNGRSKAARTARLLLDT